MVEALQSPRVLLSKGRTKGLPCPSKTFFGLFVLVNSLFCQPELNLNIGKVRIHGIYRACQLHAIGTIEP